MRPAARVQPGTLIGLVAIIQVVRRPRLNPSALAIVLLTPLAALVTSDVLVALPLLTGVRGMPSGLHTYLPLLTLVDRPSYEAVAVALGVVGLGSALRAAGPRASVRPATLLTAAALAQAVFYGAQASILAATGGLPDAPDAVLAALVLPAALWLTVSLALRLVRAVRLSCPRLVVPIIWSASTARPLPPLATVPAAWRGRQGPARAPPGLLPDVA